jgi:hypothetical protein
VTLFLLEFDRVEHRLVRPPEAFGEEARAAAFDRRAALQERAMVEQLDRDIVLLEAESEADLRRTHGSFFLTPDELADRLRPAV